MSYFCYVRYNGKGDYMVKKQKNKKKTSGSKTKKKSKSIFRPSIMIPAAIAVLFLALFYSWDNISSIIDNENSVVAEVNNEKIYLDELEENYNVFLFLSGYPEQMFPKTAYLDQMISEELVLEKADRISISDSAAEEAIEASISRSPMTLSQFKETFEQSGVSYDNVKTYFKRQLVIREHLNNTVFNNISISEKDIESYYEDNSATFNVGDGEIRASHILVSTEEEAEEIIDLLDDGADFSDIAMTKSTDTGSAARGGYLGAFGKGVMVEEFEDTVFSLKEGEVSEPVETQFGYHIIRREKDKITYEDAYDDIYNIILANKQRELVESYLASLRESADIAVYLNEDNAENNVDLSNLVSGESVSGASVSEDDGSDSCYSGYGIKDNTVIFYHAEWCPHCKNMKPIVSDLEKEGFSFYSAETSSGEGTEAVKECFSDVLQGGVPQFICAGSKEYKLGEMKKSELRSFAENCK